MPRYCFIAVTSSAWASLSPKKARVIVCLSLSPRRQGPFSSYASLAQRPNPTDRLLYPLYVHDTFSSLLLFCNFHSLDNSCWYQIPTSSRRTQTFCEHTHLSLKTTMNHSNHASNDFRTSSATDNGWSRDVPSRFKEHLSIDVPHPDLQVEHSHFSPDSPPPPVPPFHRASSSTHSHQPSVYSFGSSTFFSPRSKARDLEKADDPPIVEVPLDDRSRAPSPQRESGWGIRDRFTKFFFDAKSLRQERSEADFGIPMQETVTMEQWAPLNIEKRNPPTYAQQGQHLLRCTCCPHHHDHQKKKQEGALEKWRRRFLIFIALLFLLWVFANLVVLNAKVLSPASSTSSSSTATSSAPSSSSSSSSSTLSAAAQECITEYTVNAPNSPTTYPCSTCLPLLSVLPASITDENSAALEATQFCALRALWEDSDSTGQSGLENGGWVEDVKFCSWSGVTCDGSSRVSSLYAHFFFLVLIWRQEY